MYSWIWRNLPGPFAAKLTVALLLVAALVALLVFAVFPWAETWLPFNDVTAG